MYINSPFHGMMNVTKNIHQITHDMLLDAVKPHVAIYDKRQVGKTTLLVDRAMRYAHNKIPVIMMACNQMHIRQLHERIHMNRDLYDNHEDIKITSYNLRGHRGVLILDEFDAFGEQALRSIESNYMHFDKIESLSSNFNSDNTKRLEKIGFTTILSPQYEKIK